MQEQFPLQNKLPRDNLKMFLIKPDSSPKISKSDCWVLRILLLISHTQIPLTSKAKVEGEYSTLNSLRILLQPMKKKIPLLIYRFTGIYSLLYSFHSLWCLSNGKDECRLLVERQSLGSIILGKYCWVLLKIMHTKTLDCSLCSSHEDSSWYVGFVKYNLRGSIVGSNWRCHFTNTVEWRYRASTRASAGEDVTFTVFDIRIFV